MSIPNELSCLFNTPEGRKEIIRRYADSHTMFTGENEDGEHIYLSISKTGMVLETDQENGWTRINLYDEEGQAAGETFGGKWK